MKPVRTMRLGGNWAESVKAHRLKSDEAASVTKPSLLATNDFTGLERPGLLLRHRIRNTIGVFGKPLR
jgi:hypothetical protein